VFIAADTAITVGSNVPIITSLSSFGEVSYNEKNNYVFEALLKICLVDKIIIAFAGNVDTALNIISVFKQFIPLKLRICDGLEEAISSCGPYSNENNVALIVGYYDKNGPKLISYNHDGNRNIHDHNQCVQIGSIETKYRTSSEIIINTFLRGNLADEHMLAGVTAVLQSYGIFDHLMRISIGGVFFGISVDANGVSWQRDTSYVLYTPDLKKVHFISIYSVDNALAVASSYISPAHKVFMNTINTNDVPKWKDKWMPELIKKLNSGKSIFYTFLSVKDRLITVTKKTYKSADKYFTMSAEHIDGKEKFTFIFSPEFIEILKGPKSVEEEFRFNWLND